MKNDAYWREVVDPGDRASEYAKAVCAGSLRNCAALQTVSLRSGALRGGIGWLWNPYLYGEMAMGAGSDPDNTWMLMETIENDGAGGKLQFPGFVGLPELFSGAAWEAIVMCAEDIVRHGGFPALMVNEVQAKSMSEQNFHLFKAFMDGYGAALAQARLANITGEVAIMRNNVTAFCDTGEPGQLLMTSSGACVGLIRRSQLIDPSYIIPGLAIVGFPEPGYRCNGGGIITKIGMHKYGPDLRKMMEDADARRFFSAAATPSRYYGNTISRLNGWNPDGSFGGSQIRFFGIAHNTGGGLMKRLGEILPPGVGAYLHNMPTPADILIQVQDSSFDHPDPDVHLSDYKMHTSFHGGCGILALVEPMDADKLVAEARNDGLPAQVVGETTRSRSCEIVINSKFMSRKRGLSSLRPE